MKPVLKDIMVAQMIMVVNHVHVQQHNKTLPEVVRSIMAEYDAHANRAMRVICVMYALKDSTKVQKNSMVVAWIANAIQMDQFQWNAI